jgi:two-component system sensor histidine kinase ChiS
MMPGMSGYEVTRLVRQTYSLAELPILLLTAKNNLNDQLRGLQMGANDFITKPFESDDLQTRLDFHLLLSTKSG